MYLDPGFGSMIIQLVVALIAGAGAIWLMAKTKIKNLFKKKSSTESATTADSQNADESKQYTIEE